MKHSVYLRGAVPLAVVALILSACGSGTEDDSDSTTVTVTATSDQKASLEAVIKAFESENADVDVKPTYLASTDQIGTAYSTQFQSGSAPDVVWLMPGNSTLVTTLTYAQEDQLVDLSGISAVADLSDTFRDGVEMDGKVYGFPTGADTGGFFVYNKDLFDENGVSVPQTFSELISLCGTLSDKGITPIAWSPGDGGLSFPMSVMTSATVYADDPDFETERAAGDATFSDSGWRDYFERLGEMKDADCFSEGALGTQGTQAGADFANGKAAIWPAGAAMLQIFLSIKPDLNYGLFMPPSDTGTPPPLPLSTSNIYGVNAKTSGDTRDASMAFVEFIADNSDIYQAATPNISLTNEDIASGQLPVEQYPPLEGLAENLAAGTYTNPFGVWTTPKIAAALNDGNAAIFSGQKSVDEILADMDTAAKG